MLQQVLHEIKTAKGALSLNELNKKLGIERSALEGMIQFLVQTDRLLDEEAAKISTDGICTGNGCPACAIQPDSGSTSQTSARSYSLQSGRKPK